MTRSDVRASLDYRREAVVDNDADLLAAAVGERGVDGDPADEQLNDLPRSASDRSSASRSRISASTSSETASSATS